MRRVVFEPIEDGVPTLFHAFDNAWDIGSAEVGARVGNGAGFGNKVTADDFIKLGTVRVVLVVELGFRLGVPVIVFRVCIFLQRKMCFFEHLV